MEDPFSQIQSNGYMYEIHNCMCTNLKIPIYLITLAIHQVAMTKSKVYSKLLDITHEQAVAIDVESLDIIL